MATFDIIDTVGKNRPMTTRRVEIPKEVDFAEQNLAATETAAFMTTPKGFVLESCDAFLLTAEGEAATVDIGTEANPDGLLDGGNVNGTPGAAIAKAGTEAIVAGTYLSATDLVIGPPAAAATLNVGKVLVVLTGYVIDGVE